MHKKIEGGLDSVSCQSPSPTHQCLNHCPRPWQYGNGGTHYTSLHHFLIYTTLTAICIPNPKLPHPAAIDICICITSTMLIQTISCSNQLQKEGYWLTQNLVQVIVIDNIILPYIFVLIHLMQLYIVIEQRHHVIYFSGWAAVTGCCFCFFVSIMVSFDQGLVVDADIAATI